jgi:hypothetical protein
MLQCDFCADYWHLDCCDPPLANPPPISLEAAQRDAWRCPRHIEHDLRSGKLYQHDLSSFGRDEVDVDADFYPRIPRKVRKPKHTPIVEPTFSRGLRNNGLIEVINDPGDETDGEGNYEFGTNESGDLTSSTFRLPEKGIVLDFLGKVKQYVQFHHLS